MSWWVTDRTTIEGTHLEALTTFHGFEKLKSIPIQLLPNSTSCIDLIFTEQPNLVVDGGVHPTLHSNCPHQIVLCKFNFKIEYPPQYERLVWDYRKANSENLRKSIDMVNWEAKVSMTRSIYLIKH